jgi:2,3-bisphosphoglycerate-dependent phosphoglycerate mutase
MFKFSPPLSPNMAKLVLIRHGESLWNKENRFTGWIDIDLSEKGKEEAHEAARKIAGIAFDIAYTSALCRAQHTLDIILQDIRQENIPVLKDKALNERMYGDLQGKNKDEMRREFGAEQVQIWRRSFDIAPPNGESLKDTCARTLPYYKKYIQKDLLKGKNVLVVAHGNSLRSIVKCIEEISDADIPMVEMPTGQPWVYEMEKKGKMLVLIKKEVM